MQNDRMYAGIFFNEMLQRAEIHGSDGSITRWSDADEAQSMCYIEEAFGLYSKDKHAAAMRILFEQRKYNPIQNMINEWIELDKVVLNTPWDSEENIRKICEAKEKKARVGYELDIILAQEPR